jgi:hypothetical protein
LNVAVPFSSRQELIKFKKYVIQLSVNVNEWTVISCGSLLEAFIKRILYSNDYSGICPIIVTVDDIIYLVLDADVDDISITTDRYINQLKYVTVNLGFKDSLNLTRYLEKLDKNMLDFLPIRGYYPFSITPKLKLPNISVSSNTIEDENLEDSAANIAGLISPIDIRFRGDNKILSGALSLDVNDLGNEVSIIGSVNTSNTITEFLNIRIMKEFSSDVTAEINRLWNSGWFLNDWAKTMLVNANIITSRSIRELPEWLRNASMSNYYGRLALQYLRAS